MLDLDPAEQVLLPASTGDDERDARRLAAAKQLGRALRPDEAIAADSGDDPLNVPLIEAHAPIPPTPSPESPEAYFRRIAAEEDGGE